MTLVGCMPKLRSTRRRYRPSEVRTDWPTIGGRVHPDDLYLLDRVVLKLRRQRPDLKRADFLIEAAIEKARTILKKAAA